MAIADRIKLQYKAEVTYGVQPTGSNYQELRVTGESLKQDTSFIESAEIRSDRQVTDVIRTDIRVTGSIDCEVSYGTLDDLFEASLFSGGWAPTAVSITGTVHSMAAGDNSINRSAGDYAADGFAVNQWIVTSGFATGANNSYFKIVSVTATKMVLSNGTVVTEAAGATVTIKGFSGVANGTSVKSFSIERVYTDLSSEAVVFTGIEVEALRFDVTVGQIATCSVDLIGKKELSITTPQATTAANANAVMNAVDDVVSLSEGGTALVEILALSFSVNNNLRVNTQIGTLGAVRIGSGKCATAGTFRAYYQAKTQYDKYLNNTPSSLVFIMKDAANNRYIFEFPKVKIVAGSRPATGQNTDIVADFNFTAYRNSVDSTTVRIARLPGTV